jgi:hypothetical protein
MLTTIYSVRYIFRDLTNQIIIIVVYATTKLQAQ